MAGVKFRLAMREEDGFWNAYCAQVDTMQGAVFLGSIPIAAVEEPELKAAFMDLMMKVLARAVADIGGGKVTGWEKPKPAPFWEKKR